MPLPARRSSSTCPTTLDFADDHGKVPDRDGVGTGFTYVDPPTNGTGYIPDNLFADTATGALKVTTTAGLSLQDVNSCDNALAVGIDAPSQVTRIETTLTTLTWKGGNEQAGLWFGTTRTTTSSSWSCPPTLGPDPAPDRAGLDQQPERGHNSNRGPTSPANR